MALLFLWAMFNHVSPLTVDESLKPSVMLKLRIPKIPRTHSDSASSGDCSFPKLFVSFVF